MNLIKNKISIWILLSLLGLCLFLGLIHWNSFNAPFERDEGDYSYSAWILGQGIPPYENSFVQKLPMVMYTYWLGQVINSNTFWPPRVISFIFIVLTTILIGFIARHEFGESTGLIAMWLLTPMIMFPYLMPFAANTEKFMLLPLVGFLAIYIFNRQNTKSLPWFFAGVCSVLALAYKQICLFAVLFIFSVWVIETWLNYKDLKLLLKNVLWYIAGGLLTILLILLYFIVNNAMGSLWECTVYWNACIVKSYKFTFDNLIRHTKLFLTYWWILFIYGYWFLHNRPSRWWYYVGTLFTMLLGVYLSVLGHYYISIMPFWVLINAAAIKSIIDKIKIKSNPLTIEQKRIATVFLVFVTLFIMCWPIRKQFTMSPKQINLWVYGTVNPFLEAPVVAKHLADVTNPTDYVLIAGSESEILYYAKRRSSTRFVITYPLILECPRRLVFQQRAITEIESRPPEAIVVSRRGTSGLWEKGAPRLFVDYLSQLINNNYKIVGGFVWKNNEEGYWQEPINNEQINLCSFLLFKKIPELKNGNS